MDVIKKTQTAKLLAVASLEYVELGDDLAVYRLTKAISPEASPPGLLAESTTQVVATEGFVSLCALKKHVAGNAPFPMPAKNIALVPEGFVKLAAQLGFSEGWEKAQKANPEFEATRPFTMLVEGKASLGQVLAVDASSHMLFDRQGNVLPVGIAFEYLMAEMDNARYDLERALEILKKHERVRFLDAHGYPTNHPKILHIPGYNTTEHRTQYLHFVLEPTADEMRLLWERQLSYGEHHASMEVYRAEFELDILGLRAGDAAFFTYPAQSLDNTGRP